MRASALYLGLPSVHSSDETDASPTLVDMRYQILSGARHSRLIRDCLEFAEHHDLSEEDMYVWLAFHALVRLENPNQACTCSKGARDTINVDAIDGHF